MMMDMAAGTGELELQIETDPKVIRSSLGQLEGEQGKGTAGATGGPSLNWDELRQPAGSAQ